MKVRRRYRAGISPVLATLILIVIAVVAGLMVYAWVSGWMGGWLGAAGKELKVVHIIFDKGVWSDRQFDDWKVEENKEVTYNVWSKSGNYYYIKPGTVEIEVPATGGGSIVIEDSGGKLVNVADGTEVGSIDYDGGVFTIDYNEIDNEAGGEKIKVSCELYRIRLFIKNTGGEKLSVRRIWYGTTSDCPNGLNVKDPSLPYTLSPGSEKWFYAANDFSSGLKYFFKVECTDGSVFGPFSKTAP